MSENAVITVVPLDFQWPTLDPFLFCVHHQDFYPQGNAELGPQASLSGRNLGQDFTPKDGWRMYHGERVPGFPGHPHRGFETVTIVQRGFVDHADSLGAAGRYGEGDVQWMTAGKGVQHSEMFPLLHQNQDNPMELFQIWLNLPRRNKLVKPHFTMIWSDSIPLYQTQDAAAKKIQLEVIAGSFAGLTPPAPPPDSWAADPDNQVAIWILRLEAGAQWTLPAAAAGLNRVIYYFQGSGLTLADTALQVKQAAQLESDQAVCIQNGESESRLLLLQGKAIDEPVVQHGPFVMNSQMEIQQAFMDYRQDSFGGWPWPEYEHVHPADKGRFARYADGREELGAEIKRR